MRIKNFSLKKKIVTMFALATVAVGLPVAVYAGFAPSSRPTFQCITPTNCPGADKVVFNSFTNAPNYGDERAFFDAKDSKVTGSGGFQDSVAVSDGQKLTARIYIHNNANPKAIGDVAATAKNTRLQVLLPTNKATSNKIAAQIAADNAAPANVSDTVDLVGTSPFTVDFDTTAPVQITYRPNGTGEFVTRTLPSAAFANPSTLNANFGDWKGCFEFAAFVTVTVNVKMDLPPPPPPKVPDFKIEKGVRIAGSNSSYQQDVTTKYGDNVDYQILVKNTGETELKNVVVKDNRPVGVDFTAGSLKLNGVTSSADLFGAGVTVPSIAVGGQAVITFSAKVNKLDNVSCDLKTYRNIASAKPEGLNVKEDDANVKASCDNPVPKFVCDSLKAEKTTGRTVKFTASATATGGATIANYIYNFGDSNSTTTNNNTVSHTYGSDGEFTASLKVEFLVDGKTVSDDGPECRVTVKFDKPEEPKKPVFSCDLLSLEKTGGRSIKLTANATASNGAVIKRYVYTFGDGSEQTTDANTITHTYAKDGKYVARVKVQIGVGNETITAESDKCAVAVEFTTPVTPETPVTPTTPGKLPDTGAGSVITAFMAVSGLGSLGFSLITRRSRS